MTCFVSTMFDSCVPILWIRHLATKLHQVNRVSPNPFLNTLLHIVTTVPGIDVEGVHKRGIDRTSIRSMRRVHSTVQTKRHSNHQQIPTQSSLSSLQFCPPRLKYSLQLQKLLECGSCSMSPLCVVPAIQTSEVHRDSVGTRQQLMASVKTRHQRLLRHCGSHTHVASISGCLCWRRRNGV